jgi:alpha-tubulin suppressor-like RCC1 family protein
MNRKIKATIYILGLVSLNSAAQAEFPYREFKFHDQNALKSALQKDVGDTRYSNLVNMLKNHIAAKATNPKAVMPPELSAPVQFRLECAGFDRVVPSLKIADVFTSNQSIVCMNGVAYRGRVNSILGKSLVNATDESRVEIQEGVIVFAGDESKRRKLSKITLDQKQKTFALQALGYSSAKIDQKTVIKIYEEDLSKLTGNLPAFENGRYLMMATVGAAQKIAAIEVFDKKDALVKPVKELSARLTADGCSPLENYFVPKARCVVLPAKAYKISASGMHSCALLIDSTVNCWGQNGYGQLGDGTTTDSYYQTVKVVGLKDVLSIFTGRRNTCALLKDRTLKCWGYNGWGQVGDGTSTNQRNEPVTVAGISGVLNVAIGSTHTCALLEDRSVKCWGYNNVGQLGDGTNKTSVKPVSVKGLVKANGLFGGDDYTCVNDFDTHLYCWGGNRFGQLGTGDTENRLKPVMVTDLEDGASDVSINYSHSCVRSLHQHVYCWGDNRWGQLGDGTTIGRLKPVRTKTVWDIAEVSVGAFSSCTLGNDFKVHCWGNNYYGQLGDGTTTNRSIPQLLTGLPKVTQIVTGHDHACVLLGDQTVRCWGYGFED